MRLAATGIIAALSVTSVIRAASISLILHKMEHGGDPSLSMPTQLERRGGFWQKASQLVCLSCTASSTKPIMTVHPDSLANIPASVATDFRVITRSRPKSKSLSALMSASSSDSRIVYNALDIDYTPLPPSRAGPYFVEDTKSLRKMSATKVPSYDPAQPAPRLDPVRKNGKGKKKKLSADGSVIPFHRSKSKLGEKARYSDSDSGSPVILETPRQSTTTSDQLDQGEAVNALQHFNDLYHPSRMTHSKSALSEGIKRVASSNEQQRSRSFGSTFIGQSVLDAIAKDKASLYAAKTSDANRA